jgi:hypothetical protein
VRPSSSHELLALLPIPYPAIRPWLAGGMQFDQLRRHEFITLLRGAAARPLAAPRAAAGGNALPQCTVARSDETVAFFNT